MQNQTTPREERGNPHTHYSIDGYCLPEQRDAILGSMNLFGLPKGKRWYVPFTSYLLHSTFRDKASRRTIVGKDVIAEMRGIDVDSSWSAKRSIEEYVAHTGIDLTLHTHDYQMGRSRSVSEIVLPGEAQAAFDAARRTPAPMGERVSFTHGTVSSERNRNAERLRAKAQADASASRCHDADSRELLLYLNGLPPRMWHELRGMVPDMMREAWRIENPASRDYALAVLARIEETPQQMYNAVEGSSRVYPANGGLLSLNRGLRGPMMAGMGWHSFDLAHAHLSIVTKTWNVPAVREFLRNGGDFWGTLMSDLEYTTQAERDELKRAIYSLLFGASYETIKNAFDDLDRFERWIAHPLIKPLNDARRKARREVKENGYQMDALGNRWDVTWRKVNKDGKEYNVSSVNRVLASVTQSYETKILSPVVRIMSSYSRHSTLTYRLHDGFGIRSQDGRIESISDRLIESVDKVAEREGIPTYLSLVRH